MDEAVLRIVVDDDAAGSQGAPGQPVPTPPPQPTVSTGTGSRPQPVTTATYAPSQPVSQPQVSTAVASEFHAAMLALGHTSKEADTLTAQMHSLGTAFVSVQDALAAFFMHRPPQPTPATTTAPPQPSSSEQQPPSTFNFGSLGPNQQPQKPVPVSSMMAQMNQGSVTSGYMTAGMTAAAKPAQPPPLPSFDAIAIAGGNRENQVRSEQIRQAYEQMYGSVQQTKSMWSLTLDLANTFRGTIGGLFGTIVGSVLDVVQAFRSAKKPEPSVPEPIRREAAARNAALPQMPQPTLATSAASQPAQSPTKTAAAQPATATAANARAAESSTAATLSTIATVGVGIVGAAVSTIVAVGRAASESVQRYAGYSPQISQAESLADIRTMQADIRRANMLADNLSEFVDVQSRMENAFEDLKTQVLNDLLPVLNALLEVVTVGLKALQVAVEGPIRSIERAMEERRQDNEDTFTFDPFRIQIGGGGGFGNEI